MQLLISVPLISFINYRQGCASVQNAAFTVIFILLSPCGGKMLEKENHVVEVKFYYLVFVEKAHDSRVLL